MMLVSRHLADRDGGRFAAGLAYQGRGDGRVVPFWRPREDTGHRHSTGTGSSDGIDQALVKVVAHMADGVKTQSHSQDLQLTLNSDGRRHPVLNAMTLFTFAAGIVAFACGLIVKAHAVGAILGIVAFSVG